MQAYISLDGDRPRSRLLVPLFFNVSSFWHTPSITRLGTPQPLLEAAMCIFGESVDLTRGLMVYIPFFSLRFLRF